MDDCEFEVNEVYAIDIVMSSGDGKPKEVEARTCVFKKSPNNTYNLKLQAARQTFSEINTKFPTFPFALRGLDGKKVLFGIKECVTHDLVTPYPVLFEKEGEVVAHLKFTALVTANGTVKVAGVPLNLDLIESDKSVKDEALVALLATSAGAKKKKKKAAKKKK